LAINIKAISQIQSDIQHIKPDADLLIVSKNQSIEDIQQLVDLKHYKFGENKVQEAKKKYIDLNLRNKINLHLIGPLQSNKVKDALQIFDVIQTIDRKKIIDEIVIYKNKPIKFKTNSFYIQVNIGNEVQKSGVSPNELASLYNYCLENKMIISGLMCIPPNGLNATDYFKIMNNLKNELNPKLLLSMGMSSDYKDALCQNSNLIRIGSLIFNNE